MCKLKEMEKKSLFEKPRLAEDGTALVEKYYKRTCFCHN